MKSKIYILVPWPECQKLDQIEGIENEIIHPMSDDPSIANSVVIPLDIAADYLDGEIINDEFIWNEEGVLPPEERYKVIIHMWNATNMLESENIDILRRAAICIQETFKAGTYLDQQSNHLTVDRAISEGEWKVMFKKQFNMGAITLEFTID